jgi:hypothetical protein
LGSLFPARYGGKYEGDAGAQDLLAPVSPLASRRPGSNARVGYVPFWMWWGGRRWALSSARGRESDLSLDMMPVDMERLSPCTDASRQPQNPENRGFLAIHPEIIKINYTNDLPAWVD